MTKTEALKLLASDVKLDDLILKQIREAIADGVSSAETDAAVAAKHGTALVLPVVNTNEDDGDEYYESSEAYVESWESSEC